MRKKTRTNVILLFCILTRIPAISQIVNIETARMQSDTTGWMGSAGASLSLVKNTEQIFTTNVNAHLQYKSKRSLYLLLGSYGFLKSADTRLIDNTFLHLRYNYKLNKTINWEVFTQLQNNVVTKIQSRFLLGTGPRFKILSSKIVRLYAASLLMYEREEEQTADNTLHNNARSSSYVSFSFTPNNMLEIVSTTFFQPLLNNWNDYRILNQLGIKAKATKKFSISIDWNYLNDSHPVEGIPPVNYSISTGLEYDF
jgi:hypothetical protein